MTPFVKNRLMRRFREFAMLMYTIGSTPRVIAEKNVSITVSITPQSSAADSFSEAYISRSAPGVAHFMSCLVSPVSWRGAGGRALRATNTSAVDSSIAVFGRPLLTDSFTFFHCSSRGGWAAVVDVMTSATPAATNASANPKVASRCDRFMVVPRCGEGNSADGRDCA